VHIVTRIVCVCVCVLSVIEIDIGREGARTCEREKENSFLFKKFFDLKFFSLLSLLLSFACFFEEKQRYTLIDCF
jgi:hypothetical protein